MTSPNERRDFRTPMWLKGGLAGALAVSIGMMVSNSEKEKMDLSTEVAVMKEEVGSLKDRAGVLVTEKTDLLVQLSELRTDKLTMAASLAGYSKRELMLERTVAELRDELLVAREEAKVLVANFERTSTQMRDLVSRTDEQAYSVLKENSSLKTSARQREAQMLDLLSEVSSLNTEIAFLKDEREDMNREIGKLTAALNTISSKRETKRVSLR